MQWKDSEWQEDSKESPDLWVFVRAGVLWWLLSHGDICIGQTRPGEAGNPKHGYRVTLFIQVA